ncbi:PorV/PorQ family protein [Plebeiibacterium sediminum]|uniref:PorV/PorQ family protein n=1 Tax=Plebeiibacterium sediminum TaxID=2992112 RepID=A0AAE3M4W6_9BACT|nr:PorV/PorQ family protein [Plebeiobacterium sediminum]MCW3786996.1 PorV/PorQ family protein [Plebeiobacterium sediminum]
MIIKRLLTACIALYACTNIFSQAGSFISIPTDTRSVAMGGTYLATNHSNAIFTNLAANSIDNKTLDVSLSYRPWVSTFSDDYNIYALSAFYSLSHKHKIAFGYRSFNLPKYTLLDDNGNNPSSFTPKENTFDIGYAYKISDHTALSASLHYLNSEYGQGYDANTIFLDLGFKSKYKALEYGAMVRNIGGDMEFDDGSVALPLTIGVGLGYSKELDIANAFNCSLDISHISGANDASGIGGGLGLEYQYKSMLSLRTGYQFLDESIGLNYYSIGAGINLGALSCDFAYLITDNALKNNYSLSLSWTLFNKKSIEE